jgi:phosphonoacetate hydrolase
MQIEVNGRQYRTPRAPVAVICFNGCDPAYLADACNRDLTPHMAAMGRSGFHASALSAMPSFTNPNNVSIVCGAPPRVYGISGNYWLDRASGREVMMTDAGPLEAPTILARLAKAGVPVAAITAKDKLRKVLASGLVGEGAGGIAFSAERAAASTRAEHGISAEETAPDGREPNQYFPELSLFVLDAGVRLLRAGRARLLYLSLSDFVQHAHAPGDAASDAFMSAVDERVGALVGEGALVGIVADHGMTDLSLADGRPNVLYLGDILDEHFGPGRVKVICPITDPFVRHHGALGGFVRVHIVQEVGAPELRCFIARIPGVQKALLREEARDLLDLPPEREGDVAVIAVKGVASGAHRASHDLAQLAGARLRSHGSLAERDVPFLLSAPVSPEYEARAQRHPLYNYDIFDFALNGARQARA